MTTDAQRRRVGFIGLGLMGKPMARNLLRAGWPVIVHNRSRAAVKDLANEGAVEAFSSAEVAASSDVILLSLPNWPDVEAVISGPSGILESVAPGAIVVDTTSGLPDAAQRFAEILRSKGADYIDAPVSGGDVGAKQATLSIMAGGSEASFRSVLPVLSHLGKTIVRVGDVGAGSYAKLANQILVAVTLAGMGEAFVFAARAGVRLDGLLQALQGGLARCGALEVKAPKVIRGDFQPGGKAELQLKDLNNIFGCACELGVSLPVTELVRSLYERLIKTGHGAEDHSAIIRVIEDLAGVEARL